MEKPLQKTSKQSLNTADNIRSNCQVRDESQRRRALAAQTKGLVILAEVETRKERPLRDGSRDLPGTLVDFAWKMKKRGLAEETIKHRVYRLNVLIKKGADLQNPDSVETVLATEPWKPANKRFFVMAYQSFTKTFNIPWIPIKVKCENKQPFIPLESEIDQLIAGCGKRTATFLQVLKDTGARCGEIKSLKWTDVDDPKRAIRINDPEKGSNSRTVQVTPKTLAMLNALPKRSIYVFSPLGSEQPPKIRSLQSVFSRQRNKLAVRLQNPRLKQIHFHTLRHWKATMEYAKTRDILRVKQLLGHKRLENTEIYTHLIDFATDDYTVRRPKTSKEEDELIEAGFEYVRYDDKEQCPIYRNRK
jgi:integrase